MIRKRNKLVCGVGINDADYQTSWIDKDGKAHMCTFYATWVSMLRRCYSSSSLKARPNYINCTVVPEWHLFSTFKSWMLSQDHQKKVLDKDLLFPGNTEYSPEKCVFVDIATNSFFNSRESKRGQWPIGVVKVQKSKTFLARVNIDGVTTSLGTFSNPEEAHEAWKKAKREQAKIVAARQSDPRVAAAILTYPI